MNQLINSSLKISKSKKKKRKKEMFQPVNISKNKGTMGFSRLMAPAIRMLIETGRYNQGILVFHCCVTSITNVEARYNRN